MPSDDLDELEHQALDRLEELDAGEQLDADGQADAERVALAFARLAPIEADRILLAALALAQAEPGLALDAEALARERERVRAEPSLAAALAPTIELIGLGLGLARERRAWQVLVEQGERAGAAAPAELALLSAELAALLRDAWPRPDAPPPSLGLRVFRVAALAGAGAGIRARALAAERPEAQSLAAALLAAHPNASASALVEAFDRACTDAAQGTAASEPELPGPKRRFTWVHALLAAIILGLTVWHYLLR